MHQKIFLDSKSGKVCCVYNKMENSNSIVIISHGYLSDKNSRTGLKLAQKLNSSNISTISLDLYGHGESEGDIEYLTISKAVDNVLAVYDFVKSEGFQKIGLVGSSLSGIVSLIVASKRKIDALSLKCPVFDYKGLWDDRVGPEAVKEWKEKGFMKPFGKRMHYEIYEDSMKYKMKNIAKTIIAPTIVIHGDKDTTVPLQQAKDLLNSVSGQKKLAIIKGADHFFHNEDHFNQMVNVSFEWLLSKL